MERKVGQLVVEDDWLKKKCKEHGINPRGWRWGDNVFIERLWRSVKYKEIYPRAHENLPQMEVMLTQWFEEHNRWRPQQAIRSEATEAGRRPGQIETPAPESFLHYTITNPWRPCLS